MIVQSKIKDGSDAQIPRRWLPIVRMTWLVLVLLLISIKIMSIPPYFYILRVACAEPVCSTMTLSPEEVMVLQDIGLSMDFYAGYQIGIEILSGAFFLPLAVLVFWRQSNTWMGVLASFIFVTLSVNYTIIAELIPELRWTVLLIDIALSGLLVLWFYIFPDGRFVPRWTSWVVCILFVAAFIDTWRLNQTGAPPSISILVNALWLGSLLIGVFIQIYRYRVVSTPTQRQQTKWILYGLISFFFAVIIWTLLGEMFPVQTATDSLKFKFSTGILAILVFALPLSITFSILRYRLWDIDLVIRRTLQYTLLTGLLAMLYFGSVVLLQSLVENLSGEQSPVVIVISTLVIAALFNPLRRRVQDFIDRRFYRKKYDAEQALTQFATTARDEVELDKLTAALLGVVEETMQPEMVNLYLRLEEKTNK